LGIIAIGDGLNPFSYLLVLRSFFNDSDDAWEDGNCRTEKKGKASIFQRGKAGLWVRRASQSGLPLWESDFNFFRHLDLTPAHLGRAAQPGAGGLWDLPKTLPFVV
jgi:hypothetical protein